MDLTFTTVSNKNNAQAAVESVIALYNTTDVGGRFPAGIVSQSSTRFTVSLDADQSEDVATLKSDLISAALLGKSRSQTLFTMHRVD